MSTRFFTSAFSLSTPRVGGGDGSPLPSAACARPPPGSWVRRSRPPRARAHPRRQRARLCRSARRPRRRLFARSCASERKSSWASDPKSTCPRRCEGSSARRRARSNAAWTARRTTDSAPTPPRKTKSTSGTPRLVIVSTARACTRSRTRPWTSCSGVGCCCCRRAEGTGATWTRCCSPRTPRRRCAAGSRVSGKRRRSANRGSRRASPISARAAAWLASPSRSIVPTRRATPLTPLTTTT